MNLIQLFQVIIFMMTLAASEELKTESNLSQVISVSGNKFVDSKGYQFHIKGIAYQKLREEGDEFKEVNEFSFIDSMADNQRCLRDLPYLEKLGVNVVRVYQIDPYKNHDECMNAFAAKGIYVLCDLAEPTTSINRNVPSWDIETYDRYKAVIDAMHGYKNLLGFVAGNEVTNSARNTDASPFVKAAIRDSKNYIEKKGYRKIPVGYTGADDEKIRVDLANYFVCGDDPMAKADFFGLNMYEWCGYSSYTTSGYRDRTFEFSEYPVPVFFSEFGCNTVAPRPFTEVEALYGLTMSKVWSGGIAYEYFQHSNNYGIVKENKDMTISLLEDYDILSMRYESSKPKRTKVKPLNITGKNPKCVQSNNWNVSSVLPPVPDSGKCECLQSTFACIMSPFEIIHEYNLLDEVCSKVDCNEIKGDGSLGVYGKYSDCSTKQKVSFALNEYFNQNKQDPKACDFKSRAVQLSNNDQKDLEEIILQDGRTCKDALTMSKEAAKYGASKNENQRGSYGFMVDRTNSTSSMKSNASHLSYITIFSNCLSLLVLVVVKYVL